MEVSSNSFFQDFSNIRENTRIDFLGRPNNEPFHALGKRKLLDIRFFGFRLLEDYYPAEKTSVVQSQQTLRTFPKPRKM